MDTDSETRDCDAVDAVGSNSKSVAPGKARKDAAAAALLKLDQFSERLAAIRNNLHGREGNIRPLTHARKGSAAATALDPSKERVELVLLKAISMPPTWNGSRERKRVQPRPFNQRIV
ncbi:hypothetical protein PINS_up002123 [Pythium insidiosum]|nr:hypothetical protein PINS_up002123 [Pythium insidiosum]